MKKSPTRSGRGGDVVAATAVASILVAALAAFGLGMVGSSHPRTASTTSSPSHPTPTAPNSSPQRQILPRSAPIRLEIPTIGVHGGLQRLGLGADRKTMQLPPDPTAAGWYKDGPTPGELGPTIIVGYIASEHGPGVFRRLAMLPVGAQIAIRRSDSTTVVYRVDKIVNYPAGKFPATKVYGRTHQPTLRVVTCGGTLSRRQPRGNVVVYAHQLAVRT